MIKKLLKLANHLDAKGLRREANYLDSILRKIAAETVNKYDVFLMESAQAVLIGILLERIESTGTTYKFESNAMAEAAGLARDSEWASDKESVLPPGAELRKQEASGTHDAPEKNIEEDPVTYYKLNQPGESHIILALHKDHYYYFYQDTKSWAEGCDKNDVPLGSQKNMVCFEIKVAQEGGQLESLSGPPDEKYKFTPPQTAAEINLDLTPAMERMLAEQSLGQSVEEDLMEGPQK